ncbi:hypothetical protein ACIPX0_02130 [Streptomyces sp. NPDC090075]|uniref:hypothetical protein n=1 Tax=Streptomyces sp. NPDC090075 TaxID=3365937 RepID=UPI0038098E0B
MTPRRQLFVRLLRGACADFTVPILTLCVLDLVDEGFSLTTLRDMAGYPLAWLGLSLLWAGGRTGLLVRRARDLGVEAGEQLLDTTQNHTLTGIPFDRVRAELGATRRASDVGDGNPVDFRWRLYRTRLSAAGSVTVDDASGEALVEVRASEHLGSGILRGAAFTALCQIVRTLRPGDAK